MSHSTPRKPQVSYAELTEQVVRKSKEPLSFDEILRRVDALRRIDTRSPKATLRTALSLRRMIASTGNHTYWWYPRLITGSYVRIVLTSADLRHQPPRITLDDDAREMMWPAFFDYSRLQRAQQPVTIELAGGSHTTWLLDHFQDSDWGTYGNAVFWDWLGPLNPAAGDSLIIHALDAEAHRYRVAFDKQDHQDQAACDASNAAVFEAAVKYLHDRRAWGSAKWDVARHLLSTGHYQDPVPPRPVSETFLAALHEMTYREMAEAGIYQLLITLQNTSPPIWRRVQAPGNWSLGALHYVIQVAMGWTNSHLHMFRVGRRHIALYELEEIKTTYSGNVSVGEVWRKPGQHITYEYDFGDSWTHDIVLEAVVQPERHVVYPHCIAGERAGPPEDCGGPFGYKDLLAILADPAHEDHADMLEWLHRTRGEDFDPHVFDLADANRRLARIRSLVLDDARNVRLFAPPDDAEPG